MSSIYDIELTDLAGKKMSLGSYRGKTLLIVNTASGCGLWPQMKDLDKVYKQYKNQGLEVLGFPSNSFHQEPKEGADLQQACEVNQGVSFRIFQKNAVRGSQAQPLYKWLNKQTSVGPLWNFHKVIVDRNGKVVDWFNPWRRAVNAKVTDTIEKCLKQPVES